MDIIIDINKSVAQNAEVYYEKAKRYKKKIPGIRKTIDMNKKRLESLDAESIKSIKSRQSMPVRREWFEKFRWFYSSDDFLVIGGRDATTNDIIIKKHTEKNDLVFHTELPGSPFVIIKNPENKKVPESTIIEAAEFCASYSKSWKSGRTTAETYYIMPDQVSKEAPADTGHLAKGSFMIYGKRNYLTARLNIALCNYNDRIMAGPVSAVSRRSKAYIEIIPGDDKLSDVAKKAVKTIGGDIDTIIRSLPPGCTIKRQR